MDSSHFSSFCFLLLTVAAPCPNIAMPSAIPAKGTPDSSSGRTIVTVYSCKSDVCNSSNYEDCEIIGESQNEAFSNERIELVTRKRDIIVCFRQNNVSLEGVYVIFWYKVAVGVGDSCGILSSAENMSDSITRICCKAEIDPSVLHLPLQCDPEMAGEEIHEPPDNTTDEGEPGDLQFLVGEKSSTAVLVAVLVPGLCAAALAAYCIRRNRNGRGPVVILSQTLNDQECWKLSQVEF
ncbi:uncharacterized protein LOC127391619 isoform X2 [Apus apus]|uniref:uncharacterized protein LOC127391619 isoform X2 n=1 Tax=Apus apus TaxID=8895 RepID=UPI0021F8E1AD|nr:uncharacterized protein LOC127391619 isoform X2 [Apus apus]